MWISRGLRSRSMWHWSKKKFLAKCGVVAKQMVQLFTFFGNMRLFIKHKSLPQFSTETTAFCQNSRPFLVLLALCDLPSQEMFFENIFWNFFAPFSFLTFSVMKTCFSSLEGDLFVTFWSSGTDEFSYWLEKILLFNFFRLCASFRNFHLIKGYHYFISYLTLAWEKVALRAAIFFRHHGTFSRTNSKNGFSKL